MDLFKALQRRTCPDNSNAGSGNKPHWGCACCRPIQSIPKLKKALRKLAKARLKAWDKRNHELP